MLAPEFAEALDLFGTLFALVLLDLASTSESRLSFKSSYSFFFMNLWAEPIFSIALYKCFFGDGGFSSSRSKWLSLELWGLNSSNSSLNLFWAFVVLEPLMLPSMELEKGSNCPGGTCICTDLTWFYSSRLVTGLLLLSSRLIFLLLEESLAIFSSMSRFICSLLKSISSLYYPGYIGCMEVNFLPTTCGPIVFLFLLSEFNP